MNDGTYLRFGFLILIVLSAVQSCAIRSRFDDIERLIREPVSAATEDMSVKEAAERLIDVREKQR